LSASDAAYSAACGVAEPNPPIIAEQHNRYDETPLADWDRTSGTSAGNARHKTNSSGNSHIALLAQPELDEGLFATSLGLGKGPPSMPPFPSSILDPPRL
jgi:hypothetical protein